MACLEVVEAAGLEPTIPVVCLGRLAIRLTADPRKAQSYTFPGTPLPDAGFANLPIPLHSELVGVAGFKPAIFRTQTGRFSQTKLHAE